MRNSSFWLRIALLGALAIVIPACDDGEVVGNIFSHGDGSGSGGGAIPGGPPPPPPPPPPISTLESEPNNTAATADAMSASRRGTGSLANTGDVDFWSFPVTQGNFYHVEVFAWRSDQNGWANWGYAPKTSIIGTDQTSVVLVHDPFWWNWSWADLDIPYFRAPATGTQFLRVELPDPGAQGGAYNVVVTQVTLPNVQTESESNNSQLEADTVTAGTIVGTLQNGNDDYFSFTTTGPAIVEFSSFAYRRGINGLAGVQDPNGYLDPIFELRNSVGSILQQNFDDLAYDPGIRYFITQAGTYFLRVFTFNSAQGEYVITFDSFTSIAESEGATAQGLNDTAATAIASNFTTGYNGVIGTPGDVDLWSFTGAAGDIVRLHWYDFGSMQSAINFDVNFQIVGSDGFSFVNNQMSFEDSFSTLNSMKVTFLTAGTYHVRVSGFTNNMPYGFRLLLVKSGTAEVEPNNTTATATPFASATAKSGAISTPGDFDIFSFTTIQDEVVTFSIYGTSFTWSGSIGQHNYIGYSNLFPLVTILDSTGAQVGTANSDFTFTNALGLVNMFATTEVTFRAPSAGTFFVRIQDAFGQFDPTCSYVIQKR